MDEKQNPNQAVLCGMPCAEPVFSHAGRTEAFYTFPLEIERLSGTLDRINILLRESLLPDCRPTRSGFLLVSGEVRSFNNRSGIGNRLLITVFAQELAQPEAAVWENRVELTGTLCKAPTHRVTPMGREICDLMVAVNRRYGRSDYLPCIVWGQNARRTAEWEVGQQLTLSGRIQSRDYIKVTEDGSVTRTAYEISVSEIEKASF